MNATTPPTQANPRMAGLPAEDIQRLHAASRAMNNRALPQAKALLDNVLARRPNHAEALRLRALLSLHLGQPRQAVATLRHAIRHNPDDAQLHGDLGNMHNALGEDDDAVTAWRRAVEIDPRLPTPHFNLGRFLYQQGDSEAALAPLRRVRELAPHMQPAAVLLGNALVHTGRFEEAQTLYRDALRLKPDSGEAWNGLANLKTLAMGEEEAALLRAQWQRRDIADADRIAMGHALGKLEEDRGRHAEALAALEAANALQQRLTPWNRQAFERFVDAAIALSAELPEPVDPTLGSEVVFIVGQPRSGSTLIEQILAAHPLVEGGNELQELGVIVQAEAQRRGVPYPQWIPRASARDWHRLGREYLQLTARWHPHKPRFTDKMPENWKHAGLLRAMLPGATIIETRRDPLENAWSCYKQQFFSLPHFANSFEGIAAHFAGCERAMDAFRARQGARIFLHRHEDLLADPEARIRALLADCGLDFDPACLDFHASKRSVRTASAAQVRQPLRGDTARTPGYGALLDPLRAALGLPPA